MIADPLPSLFPPDRAGAMTASQRAECQEIWRKDLAHTLYGRLPAARPAFALTRTPLSGREGGERLTLELSSDGRTAPVEAALFLPPAQREPLGLVIGLSFLGPAGILMSDEFPLEAGAIVDCDPVLGLVDRRLNDVIRGAHAARWPLHLFAEAGIGLLLAGYGVFAPDCPVRARTSGLWPLLGLSDEPDAPGAISLWATGLSVLTDAAETLGEIDPQRIAVAGHSRLGKAALWAAANDERISAVIVNNAGCGGPALSTHSRGESLADLARAFPHWLSPRGRAAALAGGSRTLDQHHLIASVAPRAVLIGSAAADAWADPHAEYCGLKAAEPMWQTGGPMLPDPAAFFSGEKARPGVTASGPLQYHLRGGGHALLPADWRVYLAGLKRLWSGPAAELT